MLPNQVTPELMGEAQSILKAYNKIYPSDVNRKLFPELIEAIQFCFAWDFTTNDIVEALQKSTTHPFWTDVLPHGSLTGFLKPRHIESVRQHQSNEIEKALVNHERWKAKDEKHIERQKRKGFDEEGRPLLSLAVQS